jgi:hypothetical protein
VQSPYQPPQARVADAAEVARRPKPPAVRRAVLVFWIGWALGVASLAPGIREGVWDSDIVPVAVTVGIAGALSLVSAWLIVMVSRGRNWARWTLVVYIGLTWALLASDPQSLVEQGPLALAIDGFIFVMDLYGSVLILFGAGAAWFKPTDP